MWPWFKLQNSGVGSDRSVNSSSCIIFTQKISSKNFFHFLWKLEEFGFGLEEKIIQWWIGKQFGPLFLSGSLQIHLLLIFSTMVWTFWLSDRHTLTKTKPHLDRFVRLVPEPISQWALTVGGSIIMWSVSSLTCLYSMLNSDGLD